MILRYLAPLITAARATGKAALAAPQRPFSTLLPPLRPGLAGRTIAIPRPAAALGSPTAPDLIVPADCITRHPALLGGGPSQIRCGPRNTMHGHTRLIQKRRHGFLSRIRTKNGREVLKHRRAKGRKRAAWG